MTDFVVIGGGIAGVSAAAHLAPHGAVTLIEMERQLAYHTTGRSAALFVINHGAQGFRPLARASREFFENPPEGCTDAPLFSPRGLLWLAAHHQRQHLEALAREEMESGSGARLLGAEETLALVPVLDPGNTAGGIYQPLARDIDVAGLHQAFVRIARSHRAEILLGERAQGLLRRRRGWTVQTGSGAVDCDVVVNAAGAWGDEVARLAGIDPIGLVPMRRTAFMVPGRVEYSELPMVVDIDERFYFKPDGAQLLCSLAEEREAEPGDPRPRAEDVALAIERINEATNLAIRAVNSQWTGLRTFAPDRELVAGEEPSAPGFFWLVGQGGNGIATAPAYGALLASLVRGAPLPDSLAGAGVDPSATGPERFSNRQG